MLIRSLALLFSLCLIANTGFAKKGPGSVFSEFPSNESLLKFPQFELIDDFNSGAAKNHFGHRWNKRVYAPNVLELSHQKKDSRSKRGHALKVNYQLEPGAQGSFKSELGKLDVSAARSLVFNCKLIAEAKTFGGQIWIFLKSGRGDTSSKQITEYCSKSEGRWKEVSIPLKAFSGLDPNQIDSVEIQINAKKAPIQGDFWIDELSFYGKGDVAFESRRDNLVGFPDEGDNPRRRKKLLKLKDSAMLAEIARDTWKYFLNARDKKNHLVVDHIRLGKAPLAADYTSITNLAMDFMATVAAYDLKFIKRKQAVNRIRKSFNTLKRLKRWRGFYYNFYHTTQLSVTREFISSVDSGWLAISMVVVRQAFPELASPATRFLKEFDFEEFLDPATNQLSIGFDVEKGELTKNHYGLLVSEARATSYMAIGKGDLSKEHWWFLYRTPPKTWDWQNQVPHGEMVSQDGIDYFQGFYRFGEESVVPSWGGSLFEFLMPTLVMKERELGWEGLGFNNEIATRCHIDYALKEKGYPVWGISPAAMTNGRQWSYGEFGVKGVAVKGYPDRGIITPHVTFLALDTLPKEAIKNLRNLLAYKIYGQYGFYDSVDVKKGTVNPQYLALDQGMTLVALGNYLTGGAIQKRFHQDSVGKKAESLLAKESFFNL